MNNYFYGIMLIVLAVGILIRGILAFLFNRIAELKGYHGITEWLIVFFLGIYGILYVAMLPIKNEVQQIDEENDGVKE